MVTGITAVRVIRCKGFCGKLTQELQYRLKISELSINAFAVRCKLRVNALVEKSNAFANSFFTSAFGLCYSILTPLGCTCCRDVKK